MVITVDSEFKTYNNKHVKYLDVLLDNTPCCHLPPGLDVDVHWL